MSDIYVGITDSRWYRHLSARPTLEEVNFWQPSGGGGFRALPEGGLFLFKLRYPTNAVVGGAYFAGYSRLSVADAWKAFGTKNGVASEQEFVERLSGLSDAMRTVPWLRRLTHVVGCILLVQPFWFAEDDWLRLPSWRPQTQRGRGYDLTSDEGTLLFAGVQERLQSGAYAGVWDRPLDGARYGHPVLVRPRLGQGSFKVLVLDAYDRTCAITGEHVVPVLEAAHIRPYSDGGEHRVRNGLLLRSDIHTLFDRGYVTVDPDYRVRVDTRLHDEFDNGRDYLALSGRTIQLPRRQADRPDRELLAWRLERLTT